MKVPPVTLMVRPTGTKADLRQREQSFECPYLEPILRSWEVYAIRVSLIILDDVNQMKTPEDCQVMYLLQLM